MPRKGSGKGRSKNSRSQQSRRRILKSMLTGLMLGAGSVSAFAFGIIVVAPVLDYFNTAPSGENSTGFDSGSSPTDGAGGDATSNSHFSDSDAGASDAPEDSVPGGDNSPDQSNGGPDESADSEMGAPDTTGSSANDPVIGGNGNPASPNGAENAENMYGNYDGAGANLSHGASGGRGENGFSPAGFANVDNSSLPDEAPEGEQPGEGDTSTSESSNPSSQDESQDESVDAQPGPGRLADLPLPGDLPSPYNFAPNGDPDDAQPEPGPLANLPPYIDIPIEDTWPDPVLALNTGPEPFDSDRLSDQMDDQIEELVILEVPEPEALAVLIFGLFGVMSIRLKRCLGK